ncbi:MAG: hypothetical protein ACYT04_40725, partial [Nostoc sp.]
DSNFTTYEKKHDLPLQRQLFLARRRGMDNPDLSMGHGVGLGSTTPPDVSAIALECQKVCVPGYGQD